MCILITGLSTRAIAESAVRCGTRIVTLDYFGDRDQAALVENLSLKRDFALPFSPGGLLEASRQIDCQQVVYISNLENHADVVDELARGRRLLGNPPAVLRRVRNWRTLRAFCARSRISFPQTLLPGEEGDAAPDGSWLQKPARGGGGHGIRWWTGEPLGRTNRNEGHFLQRHVPGQPASAAFVADGQHCVVLGLTEQLIGCEALGNEGFGWCGNILPLTLPTHRHAGIVRDVEYIASQLTREFRLRGVNGIDLVIGEDFRVHLIEVNPRYTASMELVEAATGLCIFDLHLQGLEGRLPDWTLADQMDGPWFGKGIVYARQALTVPDTEGWLGGSRRDVPYPGDRIKAGHPVCTVLAEGMNRTSCCQGLVTRSESVRRDIGDRTGGVR